MPENPRDKAERLFLEQLKTIEGVIRFVTRRARLGDTDAEDFASSVKLRFIDNDYAILRTFEERCSFATFVSIVVNRMLLDHRIRIWGKWHPSAEAKRMGSVAIELEKIIHRDDRSLDEALPLCRKIDPAVTAEQLQEMARRLPTRAPRPRDVALDDVSEELRIPPEDIQESALARERAEASRIASAVIRDALTELPDEDRLLLRLHFGAALSIAQVGRILDTEHKPLYRRLHRLLARLRQKLESNGITAARLEDILANRAEDLDWGLDAENAAARPSNRSGRSGNSGDSDDDT